MKIVKKIGIYTVAISALMEIAAYVLLFGKRDGEALWEHFNFWMQSARIARLLQKMDVILFCIGIAPLIIYAVCVLMQRMSRRDCRQRR